MNFKNEFRQLNLQYILENKKPELVNNIEEINNMLELIEKGSDDELGYGCKVLVKKEDGGSYEGRVKYVNRSGTVRVASKTGYEKTEHPRSVKNLSVGTIGKLEKKAWILKRDLEHLNSILSKYPLPKELIELEDNIVEIVDIRNLCTRSSFGLYYNVGLIEFVHANNLRSYKLLIPSDFIKELGFYHIRFNSQGELISINKSSEFAFKEYAKNHAN